MAIFQPPILGAEIGGLVLAISQAQAQLQITQFSSEPAMSSPLAGQSPVTNSAPLEDPVQLFRTRFCLQDVHDFAAAFVSWEEASRMAGPAVANAWAATAAVPEGVTELFAVEQAVLAGRSVGAGGPLQRCQRPAQLLLRARPRQPKVRPPAAATDQVSDRLAYFFERAGAHQPVSCPEARQREWRTFLSEVAARKVSAAEPATIDRVLRTIEELERWQFSRGRADGLSDCDSVDLSAFLTEGTTAPARALSALRWFAKHGRLGWDFSELVLGKRPGHQVSARGQAIPAEPFMPSLLDQKIVTCHQQGDARWAPLLGSWLVAFGCVRHKHVERSVVIRISRSSVHLWCARGKQAHKRQGFAWCAPAFFSQGWPWAQHWLAARRALPAGTAASAGVIFDRHGQGWHLGAVTRAAQDLFGSDIDWAEKLTTYSWRRVGPSLGVLLQWDEPTLFSLGDWQDRKASQAMPVHYAATRYSRSLRTKHYVLAIVRTLSQELTWQGVGVKTLESAQAGAAERVDRAVSDDRSTVWSNALAASARFTAKFCRRGSQPQGSSSPRGPSLPCSGASGLGDSMAWPWLLRGRSAPRWFTPLPGLQHGQGVR